MKNNSRTVPLIVHDTKAPLPPGYMITVDGEKSLIPVPAPPAPHMLIVTPEVLVKIITVYICCTNHFLNNYNDS